MFSRYWRSYPWWFQFLQLILLIGILFFFFVSGVGYVIVPKFTGASMSQLSEINAESPDNIVNAVLIVQTLFSASVFLMPALLFAYFTHPRPKEYLGLRPAGRPIQWLIVFLLFLGAMPIFIQLESWVEMINFGSAAKAQQEKYEESINRMLQMPSFAAFLKVFLIMAVLPALGEELLFRGVFMRFAAKRTRGMVFPIFITAVMFALMHGNIFGTLSIFLAGVLLGVIYYMTGSLWLSIFGHLLNNGLQVIIMYIWQDNPTLKAMNETNHLPGYIPFIGALIFGIGLFLLIKNKTPLPSNWTDDYTREELSEKAV